MGCPQKWKQTKTMSVLKKHTKYISTLKKVCMVGSWRHGQDRERITIGGGRVDWKLISPRRKGTFPRISLMDDKEGYASRDQVRATKGGP